MSSHREDGAEGQEKHGAERRRTRRFECEGTADIVRLPAGTPRRVHLANLSLGGCLIRTDDPFPLATQVELTLKVARFTVRLAGKVRVRHKHAMGIEFEAMSKRARDLLQDLIFDLEQFLTPPPSFEKGGEAHGTT